MNRAEWKALRRRARDQLHEARQWQPHNQEPRIWARFTHGGTDWTLRYARPILSGKPQWIVAPSIIRDRAWSGRVAEELAFAAFYRHAARVPAGWHTNNRATNYRAARASIQDAREIRAFWPALHAHP